ncbi:MAG: CPBP family intramembrane glutamic endopeptidase [Dehalococcoidia bacterium]
MIALPAPSSVDRRRQRAELGVVLLLLAPSLALSFFAVRQETLPFWPLAISTILQDTGLVALIAYFLWRSADAPSAVGWRVPPPWRDALIGIALFGPMTLSASLLDAGLTHLGVPGPPSDQATPLAVHNAPEAVMATVVVVVIAIAEETLFRGYLLRRLTGMGWSVPMAVLGSSLIFSLGHGYEGVTGVITVAYVGAFFASVYVWRGSLVAPATMHFLQDFVAIVIVQLLR